MAVQSPPYVLQNGSHGSELVRREALAALPFGTAGGVVPATAAAPSNATAGTAGCSDLKVVQHGGGANQSVDLSAGQCYVLGTLGSGSGYGIGTGYGFPTVTLNGGSIMTVASNAAATSTQLTTQGIYYCYNDNSAGAVNLAVAASNGSNPRIDVVIAQVEDAAYSGSNNDWKLAVVTGTAAASPAVPALPANALVLAYLWIPTSSTSVVTANILDLRVASNRSPYNMRVSLTTTFSLTSNVVTGPITFNTKITDLTNSYATGTGLYTCPVSGLYLFDSTLTSSASGSVPGTVMGYKNGSEYQRSGLNASNAGLSALSGVFVIRAAQGDTLAAYGFQNSGGSINIGNTNTFLDIVLLSPQ